MMRSAGILCHFTSLPSPHGVGTMGNAAREFVEMVAQAGLRHWQMLPVGPTGYRDSPYQSPSTFAGNPLLIDLDDLVEDGLLRRTEIQPLAELPKDRVDFGGIIANKTRLLILAARRFLRSGGASAYERFRRTPWLDEYAMFAAIKQSYGGRSWVDWDPALALRHEPALVRAAGRLSGRIEVERAIQFFFHTQWQALARYCHRLGVDLIGDLPIFVAHDSADVWAQPDLFHLGGDGRPTVVAGVPPDYFSVTGQRWGNPLYRWDTHRQEGYRWWGDRLDAILSRFDMVRIDHFRGFSAFWEIPATEPTAVNGHWVEGPGSDFFSTLFDRMGSIPIIAEDLGVITEDVTRLRRKFGFPGMRVAQFGFDQEPDTAIHNPANYPSDVVAYTGTHDNDTSNGWFWGNNKRHDRRRLGANRRRLLQIVGTRGEEISWDLARLVFESKADIAILPIQDVLGLGSEARMNMPGREEGNWTWRLEALPSPETVERLRDLSESTGR